jgi:predicted RNA-binding Zn-ribbon protein involved in translation (DUF1610 family)
MSEIKSLLVAPDGRPARRASDEPCPECGASKEKRTRSAGFGEPDLLCEECGHNFGRAE